MNKLLNFILLITALVVGSATRASAQLPAGVFTTVQTTNTTTQSLNVGCAIGSSTCTGGINAGPIQGTLISLSSGYVEIDSFVPASQTNRLVNNSGTLQWNGAPLAVGSSVSGTTNTIPVFTASNAIGNSIMTQSGTTITVANTLTATTLNGTIGTASQPNITGLGTITSGTWGSAATKIGLASGGTNADLSGTGGTSQFLRQASLGAAITVVRPQVSDLSDSSNVALLNGTNTFSALNTFNGGIQFASSVTFITNGAIFKHANDGLTLSGVTGAQFDFAITNPSGASGVMVVPTGTINAQFGGLVTATAAVVSGGEVIKVVNSQAAAANQYGGFQADADNSAISLVLRQYSNSSGTLGFTGGAASGSGASFIQGGGTSGLAFAAAGGSGVISFYTGGSTTQRWGIGANGDIIIGGSNHIAMSIGTPSTQSGFGTSGGYSSGDDWSFYVTTGTTANTGGVISFGHTWNNAPVCIAGSTTGIAIGTISAGASGTALTLSYASTSTNFTLSVHCFNSQ